MREGGGPPSTSYVYVIGTLCGAWLFYWWTGNALQALAMSTGTVIGWLLWDVTKWLWRRYQSRAQP